MTYMTSERPLVGEPLLTPTSQRVIALRNAAVRASGVYIDRDAAANNASLTNCAVAPYARLVMAATMLSRPLLFPECNQIAQFTGFDLALLRYHPDRGTSFDFLLQDQENWLCRHLAWREWGEPLWFIPTAGDGPYVRASGWGLTSHSTPPFSSVEEREAGIILALDYPSFEGGR